MKTWRSKYNIYFRNMSGSCQFIRTSFSPDISYLIDCTLFNISNIQWRHLTWNDFMPSVSLTLSTSRAHAVLWMRLHEKRCAIASSESTLWSRKWQLTFQGQVWSHLRLLQGLRPRYPSCPTYMTRWCNDLEWKDRANTTQHENQLVWAWVPPRPLS